MSSPHDALFKAVFSQTEHARGALRSVVPPAIADALDWPTLTHCSGSFVDPVFRLVYLVFEHQSTSDGRMAFRLLR